MRSWPILPDFAKSLATFQRLCTHIFSRADSPPIAGQGPTSHPGATPAAALGAIHPHPRRSDCARGVDELWTTRMSAIGPHLGVARPISWQHCDLHHNLRARLPSIITAQSSCSIGSTNRASAKTRGLPPAADEHATTPDCRDHHLPAAAGGNPRDRVKSARCAARHGLRPDDLP